METVLGHKSEIKKKKKNSYKLCVSVYQCAHEKNRAFARCHDITALLDAAEKPAEGGGDDEGVLSSAAS